MKVLGWDHWCKDKDYTIQKEDYIGANLCEYECVCKSCGKTVNYFAYGSFESPWTFKEHLKREFLIFKVLDFIKSKIFKPKINNDDLPF